MHSKIIDARKMNIILVCSALVLLSSVVGTLIMGNFEPADKAVQAMATDEQSLVEQIIARDGEIRGIWIATVANINFPSKPGLNAEQLKAEIDAILTTTLENSLNTVIFQVRPSSDAFYSSEIFPTSEYLTGRQGAALQLDVLEYLTKEAHKLGIAVCAWVNPLRVSTTMNQSKGNAALLSHDNPAYTNQDYCVDFAGELYYDPGLPKVRSLVADGVYEIAACYEVDAIVFDDYFYPYPKEGASYNDAASYAASGSSLSLEDWRRENINCLVEECYKRVKEARQDCYFGISPFGIWCNDNGTNGGSATSGLCAYSAIYCDAKSWIQGGYIDFISPQLYWNFASEAAPYATLCDWWDSVLCDSDISLIISHGAYRYEEWGIPDEISNQVRYARTKQSYLGSAMYGYSAIAANSAGVSDCLKEVY